METIVDKTNKTSLSIDQIVLADKAQVLKVCQSLSCSQEELMFCISRIGTSFNVIRYYWEMNKDTIRKQLKENH
jgi:hypothetical protein